MAAERTFKHLQGFLVYLDYVKYVILVNKTI